MVDIFSQTKRSEIMQTVRRVRTAPERLLARCLRQMKVPYRQNLKNMAGRPDFVLRAERAIVFVHGCFWHAHSCKKGRCEPKSNVEFWQRKRQRNEARDRWAIQQLKADGWRVLVVWECQTKSTARIRERLTRFLQGNQPRK